MKMDVLFWKHRNEKPNYSTIYVRITIDKKRAEFSTNIEVHNKDWGGTHRLITARSPRAMADNETLKQIDFELRDIFNELKRKQKTITAKIVKQLYHTKREAVSFEELIGKFLIQKSFQVGTKITKSTLTAYKRYANNVYDFLKASKLSNLLVEDFKPSHADMIVSYLKKVKKHKNGYINKHFDLLRGAFYYAIDEKMIAHSPLRGYKELDEPEPELIYLEDDEYEAIMGLEDLPDKLIKTRKILEFLCETGLHFGDYLLLGKNGRIEEDEEGDTWVVTHRGKTKKVVDILLSQRAKTLLNEAGGLGMLPRLCLQKFNDYVKVLGMRAGIEKNLTSKVGRKTFTDTHINREGTSLDTTASLLGLTSTRHLKNYGSIRRTRIKSEIRR